MAKGIVINTKQLDRLAMELKGFEKEVAEAAYHAINRTIDHTITKVGQIVSKTYAVKSKEVKDTFRGGIKKPSKNDLSASITSRGHTLSLAHFPHSPNQPPTSGRKYKVRATIKRSSGRQTINTSPLPFVASTGASSDSKTKHNIFKREGTARLPITVIRTLSIPQMITNEKVEEQIQKAATEKMDERLEHEIIRSMTNIQNNIKKG